MNIRDIIVVFDCGATNVRAVAIDSHGIILASEAYQNTSSADQSPEGGRIWDVEEIWAKMCRASQKILAGIPPGRIAGATVTTFGVDGTLFGSDGRMLYPVISWQCERTVPVMNNIA
nr:FGGY family carbohydrate kinase [Bacteroidales bacterium]